MLKRLKDLFRRKPKPVKVIPLRVRSENSGNLDVATISMQDLMQIVSPNSECSQSSNSGHNSGCSSDY